MKKKIILFTLFICSLFVCVQTYNAAELIEKEVPDVWYFRKGGGKSAFSAQYTEYTIDDKVTYCIEPGMHITTNDYEGNIGYVNSPYDDEMNEALELIGYYGYDYPGHQTLHYRMATQALIWEKTGGQVVEYWTDKSGSGTPISVETEKNEINRLIQEHYIVPSFQNEEKKTTINKPITFTDNNKVLEKFEVAKSSDYTSKINGNDLIITPNKTGLITITLTKKTYTNNPSSIFVGKDNISQKMGYFGVTHNLQISIKVRVTGGKVKVVKKDKDTLSITPSGDAILKGATYGIYKENGDLVAKLTIGNDNSATSDYLELGKYYLQEITPSLGYTLDKTKYYFEITEDNLNKEVEVFEKVIECDLSLYKVFASSKTGILTSEKNVTFGIYLKSNMKLYKEVTTDNNGHILVTLPYGVYVIKQLTTTPGYEKAQDFEIVVDEDTSSEITKVIANASINSYLKVIKVDKDSHKILVKDGIKFKIKNLDTNEYICSNTTYPNEKKVCTYETRNGYFITPYVLPSGNYQIEELLDSNLDGYLWNKEALKFTINDSSNFKYLEDLGLLLEVYFENEEVKGKVVVNKIGEKLNYQDGKYYYQEIPLDNIEYALYASEDIYSGDGTLIYKKNTLINKYITKNGKFIIDNLYIGKYYLLEIKTLDNYILDNEKHYFSIDYQDALTKTININLTYKNYLKKGHLKFLKVDSKTNTPLANTFIEIYKCNDNEDILIYSGYTNDQGYIILDDIPLGNYYIKEIKAPSNYILNTNKLYFNITNSDDIVELTMVNIKVPKTSSNNLTIINYSFASIGISFILFTIYAKKRKFI